MAVLLAPRPGTGIDGAFLPISGHLWGSENLHLSVTTWLSSQAQRMTGVGGGSESISHGAAVSGRAELQPRSASHHPGNVL